MHSVAAGGLDICFRHFDYRMTDCRIFNKLAEPAAKSIDKTIEKCENYIVISADKLPLNEIVY